MSYIHEDIKTVSATVAGGRIYPGTLPLTPVYPCISYVQVGGGPIIAFEGDIDLINPIFQFDIFAKTLKSARQPT